MLIAPKYHNLFAVHFDLNFIYLLTLLALLLILDRFELAVPQKKFTPKSEVFYFALFSLCLKSRKILWNKFLAVFTCQLKEFDIRFKCLLQWAHRVWFLFCFFSFILITLTDCQNLVVKMALTFGSIASECHSASSNQMNAADRAYMQECRRNSMILIDPDKLSVSYTSTNPYHASYQHQQQKMLHQNMQLKRLNQKTRFRRSILLICVLSFLISLMVVFVYVFANYVQHDHYVYYFTLLIVFLFVIFLMLLIFTQLSHLIARIRKKYSIVHRNQGPNHEPNELKRWMTICQPFNYTKHLYSWCCCCCWSLKSVTN